jgi:hypothetical protein
MLEGGLSELGIIQLIVRDDDDADLALREFLMVLFELTQLDLANPSPVAAIKKKQRRMIAKQILVGKRAAIG